MPKVAGKSYPYTPKGKAAASTARRKTAGQRTSAARGKAMDKRVSDARAKPKRRTR